MLDGQMETLKTIPAQVTALGGLEPVAEAAESVEQLALPHVSIRPGSGGLGGICRDLWAYRELLFFLAWRDVKVRYKQTAIGAAWAVLQPLLTMTAFTIFFGRLAGLPSDGVPYPVFVFAGLLPWQLFAFCMVESANSMVSNRNLVTKVYFPRLIVPLAGVAVGLVDFLIASMILVGLMLWFQVVPTAAVLLTPFFLLLTVASALAVGLWLCGLNARYRDVRYVLPFLSQFGILVTPVAYPASLVPERWRLVFGLNPMAGVVEGFRWALVGGPPPGNMIWVSLAVVAVLLFGGVRYFRHVERTFADIA